MFESLTQTINTVRPKKYVTSKRILEKRGVSKIENPWKLSPMECEILRLICEGETQQDVGAAVGIAHKTVHTYTQRAKVKMNARTLEHAAVLFDRFMRFDDGK